MTNDDGRKPEGAPERSPKAGVGGGRRPAFTGLATSHTRPPRSTAGNINSAGCLKTGPQYNDDGWSFPPAHARRAICCPYVTAITFCASLPRFRMPMSIWRKMLIRRFFSGRSDRFLTMTAVVAQSSVECHHRNGNKRWGAGQCNVDFPAR
jgi:hypothetical protein